MIKKLLQRLFSKAHMRIKAQMSLAANYRLLALENDDLVDALMEADCLLESTDGRGGPPRPLSRVQIMDMVLSPSEDFRAFLARFITELANGGDNRVKASFYHNLVPNVLRYSLATLISGTTVTPTFKANYGALGTGATAPANSDTQLQTETARAAFNNRSSSNNVAYLDVFFASTIVGGNTYLEAGIFVDGSASANTGYLLSRVAINQTLGSTQTLTLNCSVTVS